MPLPTLSFDELVDIQVNSMQAIAQKILDFTVGSNYRALVESNAGNSLWLQALVTALLAVTRLQTSSGMDVDTFVGQFGLTREPATPSLGIVTFSRFSATQAAIIPAGTLDLTTLGALVSSVANGITYSVYADTTNPYFDPSQNAYVIPINTTSIDVPIVAVTPGAIGNVLPNQITTIVSVILYVDNVTNANALTDGTDAESDEALKIRFVLYLDSLSKATQQALAAAILSVEGVKRYKLVENEDISANPYLGFFYAVIDDGTGNASGTLLSNVQTQLYVVRGFTIAFSVYAPTAFPISITATVTTTGTTPPTTVQQNVINAIETYISEQGFNSLFPYSRVPEIIYDADPTITNVTLYTLNGGTIDILLTGTEIMTNGTQTITVI